MRSQEPAGTRLRHAGIFEMKIPFLTKRGREASKESMEVVLAKLTGLLEQSTAAPVRAPCCLLLDVSASMGEPCEPGVPKIKACVTSSPNFPPLRPMRLRRTSSASRLPLFPTRSGAPKWHALSTALSRMDIQVLCSLPTAFPMMKLRL